MAGIYFVSLINSWNWEIAVVCGYAEVWIVTRFVWSIIHCLSQDHIEHKGWWSLNHEGLSVIACNLRIQANDMYYK